MTSRTTNEVISTIFQYINSYQSSSITTKFDNKNEECSVQYQNVGEIFRFSNGAVDKVCVDYLGQIIRRGRNVLLEQFEFQNRLYFAGNGNRRRVGVTNHTNLDSDFVSNLQSTYGPVKPQKHTSAQQQNDISTNTSSLSTSTKQSSFEALFQNTPNKQPQTVQLSPFEALYRSTFSQGMRD